MTARLLFESAPCGRCGGSGSYSWNAMHGSVCFGCGGRGERLTKRGAAAQEFFTASASKPADQFKVGDLIRLSVPTLGGAVFNAFERVTAVEIEGDRVRIDSERKGQKATLTTFRSSVYRAGLSAERKAELIAAALAYQATLNKLGKPKAGAVKAEMDAA